MSRRRWLALAAVVAVSGHQAVLATGRDAAQSGLIATTHPAAWTAGVALVITVLVVATGWVAWRILALRWHLPTVPSLRLPRGDRLLRTWAAIAFTAVAIFLLQENAEHLAAHGHVPLFQPLLDGQYAASLPIFSGLALLAAVASLLLARRLRDLRSASAPSRRHHRAIPRISWRGRLADARLRARMATSCMARRGPPVAASA